MGDNLDFVTDDLVTSGMKVGMFFFICSSHYKRLFLEFCAWFPQIHRTKCRSVLEFSSGKSLQLKSLKSFVHLVASTSASRYVIASLVTSYCMHFQYWQNLPAMLGSSKSRARSFLHIVYCHSTTQQQILRTEVYFGQSRFELGVYRLQRKVVVDLEDAYNGSRSWRYV